jgi:molecular chaperone IbpA
LDDERYQIQIAVSGFSKDQIDIQLEQNKLSVNGSIELGETAEMEYLYRGLATRDFFHSFTLSDTIVVKSADIVNGVLKIDLENVIPEELKPRKILIGKDKKSA